MSTAHGGSAHGRSEREGTSLWPTPVQKAAGGVGVVFVLVAILGFIPGVTTNQLGAAGVESEAMLLGMFQVSVLHNLVHLALGVAGLVMARSSSTARSYLVGGGIIYLAVWIYGLLIDKSSAANFIPVNSADDWLHFALGAAMVALGLTLASRDRQDRTF